VEAPEQSPRSCGSGLRDILATSYVVTTREAGALSFLVISKCYVFNKLGNCNLAWCPVSSVVKLGRKGQARVQ